MHTLNVRLAVICLAVLAASGGTVFGIHELQMSRQVGILQSRSKQAEAAGDFVAAAKLLRRYVNQSPRDMEARKHLATLFTKTDNYWPIPALLEDVLRDLDRQRPTQPDDIAKLNAEIRTVRRNVVDAYVAVHRYSDAKYYLDKLLNETPNDPDLLEYRGRVYVAENEPEKAEDSFKKSIAVAPTKIESYSHLTSLYLYKMNRPQDAESCMDDMLQRNKNKPSFGLATAVYTQFQLGQGKYDTAYANAMRLLKDNPDNQFVLSMAATCASRVPAHADESIIYARRAMEKYGKNPEIYKLLAECYVRLGKLPEAIKALEDGAKALRDTPAYGDLVWQTATLYLDMKNNEEAKRCIQELTNLKDFSLPLVRFLEAREYYNEGRWLPARELFIETRPLLTDNPGLLKYVDYWVGYCYGEGGQSEQQINNYRQALQQDPYFLLARNGIADLDMADDNLLGAADEYYFAAKIKGDNRAAHDAWMSYARVWILINLRKPRQLQDWREVQHALDEADRLMPHASDIPMLESEVMVQQGRLGDARKLLTELKTKAPQGVQFWTSLASLDLREEKWDDAKQLLEDAQKTLGDKPALRLAWAQYCVRRGVEDRTNRLRALGENIEKFSSEEKNRLWRGLLSICLQDRQYDLAKQYCQLAAKASPNDAKIRYALFELALKNRDSSDIKSSLGELDALLDEIRKIGGPGPTWDYAKAVRLRLEAVSNPSLLEESMRYAVNAQIRNPTWAQPRRLIGELKEQQGKVDEALDDYQLAIQYGETDLEVVRRTVTMLFERLKYVEADKILRRLDAQNMPLSEDLLQKELIIRAEGGDFDEALSLAERAVNPDSPDYRDHLWHAKILQLLAGRAEREGRAERAPKILNDAEAALRKALALNRTAPDTWVSLVQLLAAKKEITRARGAIKEAEAVLANRVAPLAIAQCYEAINDIDTASALFEKALAQDPNLAPIIRMVADFYLRNDLPNRAGPLLERILNRQVKVSDADLAWARRSRAMLLAGAGYANDEKALELIDNNLNTPLPFPEDIRAKVQLLMKDPTLEKHEEARKLIEKLALSKNSLPEDRFILAKILLVENKWDDFRAKMQSLLLSGGQSEPRYATFYVNALLEHNALTDADAWIKKLEQTAPNTLSTVTFRAELLFRNNNWDEAKKNLTEFIFNEKARPADRWERSLLVARKIEQLGERLTEPSQRNLAGQFMAEAETWYKGYDNQRPGEGMVYASFLARRGKIADALAMVKKYAANTAPNILEEPCTTIIRSDAVTPEQLKELEATLLSAVDKSKRSPDLLSALAELYVRQDRLAEAETEYREIIAMDAKRINAYNNLGVLLTSTSQRLDEALSLVNQAISIAGPRAELLDSRSLVYMARGEFPPAIADLQSAIEQSPQAVYYFHLARVYLGAGQHDQAVEAMREARKRNLDRSMLDPPERKVFDDLQNSL